jgi:predicted  nucleic acid-binding Zn-ribbon protein
MIEERIQKIEARLKETANIPEAKKAELLELLAALKAEVGTLTSSHEEHVRNIADFMDASAHEATRAEKKPELIEASTNGLRASVEAFEASHPKLAEVVNQLAVSLSNMGL